MKLKTLVLLFTLLWAASAVVVPWAAGSLQDANNFGGSFGGVSAFFSGLALALAINSMLLQQRQSAEFEQRTLQALEHQAAAIRLIEQSLISQASAARVTALTTMIEQEESRIETLREWGSQAGDPHKYSNGIRAAQARSERYREQLRRHAEA